MIFKVKNIGQNEAISCLRASGIDVSQPTEQLVNDLAGRLDRIRKDPSPANKREIKAYVNDKPKLSSALSKIALVCHKDASSTGCAGKRFIDLVASFLSD